MLGFKRTKNTSAPTSVTRLSIDIGTEYIKTVVFTIKEGEVHVLGYDRTKQEDAAMSGAFIINIQSVVDSVDKSIGKAFTQAESVSKAQLDLPNHVILGIAGELVQGVTILVNVDRDNADKPIDKKELENTIKKVRAQTFDSTKEELSQELGIQSQQIEEIDSVINSVYVDGVKVSNAEGFKGSEMVYRVYSTFAPKIHLDSIKTVSEKLHLQLDQIVVQPYALSLAMEKVRERNSNAIFVDIGGGTTDIAIVQDGDIAGTRMFAIGGRMITKRLEEVFSINYQEAEDLKFAYTDNKTDEKKTKKIKEALKDDIHTWVTGLQLALEDFEDIETYPSDFYLCGGGALLPDIQEALLEYPWLTMLPFTQFPNTTFFFPSKVRDVVDKTRKAILPMDVTPLALARMSLEE